MKFPDFQYARPASVDEAVDMLAASPEEARALAGGQSLMPMLAFRMTAPRLLVDLQALPLREIDIREDSVRIGAMVRWVDILRHEPLVQALPLLAEAVRHVAHEQIRTRGTVGGSLCHADPAAELPGIAVACDATFELQGPVGHRLVGVADFFRGPLETSLRPGELLLAARFPAWPQGRRWGFEEFARRKGDFALAGVAAIFDCDAAGRAVNVRLSAIGVAGRPVRLLEAEAFLEGRVADEANCTATAMLAPHAVEVMGDMIHGDSEYRRALVRVVCERALMQAIGRVPGSKDAGGVH